MTNAMTMTGLCDIDPELLYPGIEEEEEEEDLDDPDEPDDDDRGDDLDDEQLAAEDHDPDEEPDEEEGPEEEQESDEPEEEPEPEPAKSRSVPHARFNEVNEALKEERAARLRLEEEMARLRGQVPPSKPESKEEQPKAFDFDDAEDRYMNAVMEGEAALAKQIRAEIRAEERKLAAQEARQALEQEHQQRELQRQQREWDGAVLEVLTAYPFLDSGSQAANTEAIEEVVALRDYHINRGKSPAEAIRLAANKIGPRYVESEPGPAKQEKAKPRPQMSPEQLERNLQRERQIPQRMSGVGERHKDIDYSALSDDEFDRLPAEERRRARGDFVKA